MVGIPLRQSSLIVGIPLSGRFFFFVLSSRGRDNLLENERKRRLGEDH